MIKKARPWVLWGCAGSVSSLAAVIGTPIFAICASALLAAVSLPPQTWTPLRRTGFGISLLVLAWVLSGETSREFVSAALLVAMVLKVTEMRTVRDLSIMAILNTIVPVTAAIQEPSIEGLLLGAASAAASLIGLDIALSRHRSSFTPRHHLKAFFTTSVMAAPLAAALYLVAPRFDNPIWSSLISSRMQTGVGDEMGLRGWGSLLKDPSTAFRAQFSSGSLPPATPYFRGPVLSVFTGDRWTNGVPDAAPKRFTGPVVRYEIEYEPNKTRAAYSLSAPDVTPASVNLRPDGVFSFKTTPANRVSVKWRSRAPIFNPLDPVARASLVLLPDGHAPRTKDLASRLRAASTSDRAFVNKAISHFSAKYVYTLSVDRVPPAADPTDHFMFNTRAGFCVHYSSAFAVMLRAGGVPARVINGYAGGEPGDDPGYIRVRQSDAHAWVEAWVDGEWVQLDPTSMVPESRENAGLAWSVLSGATKFQDRLSQIWSSWLSTYDSRSRERLLDAVTDLITDYAPAFAAVFLTIAVLALHRRRRKRSPSFFYRAAVSLIDARLASIGAAVIPGESLSEKTDRLGRTPDLTTAVADLDAAVFSGTASASTARRAFKGFRKALAVVIDTRKSSK